MGFSRILKIEFVILNLLMNKNHSFYDIILWVKKKNEERKKFDKVFVGITSTKPSQDFTLPLRMPNGLKGLLHTLNAIFFLPKDELV
jgi:hypothetical protein